MRVADRTRVNARGQETRLTIERKKCVESNKFFSFCNWIWKLLCFSPCARLKSFLIEEFSFISDFSFLVHVFLAIKAIETFPLSKKNLNKSLCRQLSFYTKGGHYREAQHSIAYQVDVTYPRWSRRLRLRIIQLHMNYFINNCYRLLFYHWYNYFLIKKTFAPCKYRKNSLIQSPKVVFYNSLKPWSLIALLIHQFCIWL